MTINSALTATEVTRLASKNTDCPVYLSYEPETEIGHATVDGAPATYPVTALTVTSASAGWTDQRAGQRVRVTRSGTLIGYYRLRKVGDATTLYLNETMEADAGLISILARTTGIQDGDLVTIIENYDLWSRKPYGTDYQDYDIAVGDYQSNPDPIVNIRIGGQNGDYAAQVAQGDTATLQFIADVITHPTNGSISYAWTYPAGFTAVSGNTTSTMTATVPVGSHRVYCTVTDGSSLRDYTVTRWVRIHDPSDPPLAIFPPTADERDRQWRRATVKLMHSTISVIPPGARCIVWSDGTWDGLDVASATQKFVGFATQQPFRLEPGYHESELEIIGSAGILDKLYGYPATFGFTGGTTTQWDGLDSQCSTIPFMMWWVLRWRCANFLETFNYDPVSTDGQVHMRKTVNIAPGSIYAQLKYLADMLDANIGSRSDGGLVCRYHPSMLADRSLVVTRGTLDYTRYSFTAPLWRRRPTTGTARWEGWLSNFNTDTKLIAQAPGEDTLGTYSGSIGGNDKVFASQSDANTRSGLALARANNEYPQIQIEIPSNYDVFEPVDMQRVVLVIPAAKSPTGAQISLTCLPTSVTAQWIAGRRKKIGMQLEAETDGVAGVTIVVPSQVTSGTRYTRPVTPRTTTVTGIGTPSHNGGTVIAVNNGKIGLTTTWFNSSPTWIDITGTGLSGTLLTIALDPFSDFIGAAQTGNLGSWALTTAGLYYTTNLLTVTPLWAQKATFTPAPATGLLRTPIWAQGVVYVAWMDSNFATVTSKVYLGKYSAYGATTDWTADVGSAHNAAFGFDIDQAGGTDEVLVSAKDNAVGASVYRVLSGTAARITGTTQATGDIGQFLQKPLYTFGGVSNTSTGASECFIYGMRVGGAAKFYKTANGGTTNTDVLPASAGLAPFASSSMAFVNDANRIAYLTETGGLWTSTDAGANWTSRGGTSANASRTIGYFPRLVAGNWAVYFSGTTAITYSPDFGASFQDKTGNWSSAIGSMVSFGQVIPLY